MSIRTFLNRQKCALSILLTLLMTGCGDSQQELPKQGSTLTVITSANYPPFEYFQVGNQEPTMVGFDIDLVKRIGRYLSYEIEIVDYDFTDVLPQLTENKGHLAIAALNPTPKRKKQVDFSKPYYQAHNVLLLPIGSPWIREDDYKGMHLAVKRGTAQEQFAKIWKQNNPGVWLRTFQNDKDIIQSVKKGAVDGAIVEMTPGKGYVQTYPEALTFKKLEKGQGVFAIAFPKGSLLVKEFNKALEHLESIGELDELKKKWFVEYGEHSLAK